MKQSIEHNRLTLFLSSFKDGGSERVMVALANGFVLRGYRVDLVLACGAQGLYLADVDARVRIVDLQAERLIKALWPLVRYLRRERPAALLAAMNHANVVAVLAQKWAGVSTRVVVSEHGMISIEAGRTRRWSARAMYALLPRLHRRANAIAAVSRGSARDLEQFAGLPAGAVHVIYNPVEWDRIQRRMAEPVPHPWLQPGQIRPVILAIGRLTEQKDFATLLRAFAAVRASTDARLLILGEGGLREELQALAQSLGLGPDDVQMPGFAANPFAYMARAAVFVLSSRWEGLPGVLIQAMACGTPVVSTDCLSGPREILEDGRWGRLVPVGDVEALAQAIRAVLSSPREQLPDVRQRARDFALDPAIDAYLAAMGLPPQAASADAQVLP